VKTMLCDVEYGSRVIEFVLERRVRSTLEISVLPDGSVRVVAPSDATVERVREKVRNRGQWILSKQRYFAQFLPRTPQRCYVPGETHLYLGRQFRLKVQPGSLQKVRLRRGFIEVEGVDFHDARTIERLVRAWYLARARDQFHRRLLMCRRQFHDPEGFTPTEIRIQRMSTRWGSMSPNGRLLLNPDLVRAPVDAIDYVITHELCHLAVKNHGPDFYALQESVMPDWKRRKERLEQILA